MGTSRGHDDDFTRHVAYQPPRVSAFNVARRPDTRTNSRKKHKSTKASARRPDNVSRLLRLRIRRTIRDMIEYTCSNISAEEHGVRENKKHYKLLPSFVPTNTKRKYSPALNLKSRNRRMLASIVGASFLVELKPAHVYWRVNSSLCETRIRAGHRILH